MIVFWKCIVINADDLSLYISSCISFAGLAIALLLHVNYLFACCTYLLSLLYCGYCMNEYVNSLDPHQRKCCATVSSGQKKSSWHSFRM